MSVTRIRRRAVVVLAVFVAALGMLVLAPFVHPVADELLCSANHHAVALHDDGMADGMSPAHGTHDHADHAAHCPLCMAVGAPPPGPSVWDASSIEPLDHVLRPIPAALSASLVGAPFPARGPPLVS